MARTETTSLWAELPSFSLYKRNQGKWVRLWTAIAIFATFALAAMSLSQSVLLVAGPALQYGIPAIIIAIGGWLAFRLVNYSRFADFLISVEGELHKVTWASRTEVFRATLVVIGTMLAFGVILFVYDWIWMNVLGLLGVLII